MMAVGRKNILIGGTGFIGSAVAQKLIELDEPVVCVGRKFPEKKVAGVEYVLLDLAHDEDALAKVLGQGNDIFLLTGQVYAGFDKPGEQALFERLLDLVRAANPARVIFASSVLVYGDCAAPASEESPLRPQDPYAVFKADCERLIREQLVGIPVGILRLSNVYGPEKNRGFIGLLMGKLVDGSEMKVNGDGTQERDYIFLDDVTQSMVVVRNQLVESDTVNVAMGISTTLLNIIRLLEQTSGKKLSYTVTGVPIREVGVSRVANDKLRERYGYTPAISIEEGLRIIWRRHH